MLKKFIKLCFYSIGVFIILPISALFDRGDSHDSNPKLLIKPGFDKALADIPFTGGDGCGDCDADGGGGGSDGGGDGGDGGGGGGGGGGDC